MANTAAKGLEVHKFFTIWTIADRVQFGALLSSGIGHLSGLAERRRNALPAEEIFGRFPPTDLQGKLVVVDRYRIVAIDRSTPGEIVDDVQVAEALGISGMSELWPFGRVELAVNVILAQGVRIRMSSGMSFPGIEGFSVSLIYLPGVR